MSKKKYNYHVPQYRDFPTTVGQKAHNANIHMYYKNKILIVTMCPSFITATYHLPLSTTD